MTKKKITPTTKFIRNLKATNGKKQYTISSVPYITGMYSSVDSTETSIHNGNKTSAVTNVLQTSTPHSKYSGWVKKVKAALIADGYTIEETEREYGDFLEYNQIQNYLNA